MSGRLSYPPPVPAPSAAWLPGVPGQSVSVPGGTGPGDQLITSESQGQVDWHLVLCAGHCLPLPPAQLLVVLETKGCLVRLSPGGGGGSAENRHTCTQLVHGLAPVEGVPELPSCDGGGQDEKKGGPTGGHLGEGD